ncbi:manganese efflux pump [Gilliamella sp. B2776]|uniref:manganese efflux pump MntP n=1 Tax=unclassified Gilliamella TaxID=2685620 RepID=UPI002269CEC2|nr:MULTISPECIES: manganese efflux pump MntP family protein [unclassified Gilliamella]MCX8650149.1 manganese efflux pump [Gilliamella sp. B2779]MCX8653504.1 manganese efflux pump [Gilliamella sp. B2737]MCX8656359.1 manganese efflux pump [Gilliamella sp. B2894]MCX8665202.1 manganese efflux pump [Gilliamella sp. B2887]MCX8691980.1 manganese efflux pump [Gilliamella sp. B2776]
MSFWAILLLALAMSTDAFAVAICRGVSLKSTPFLGALKVGILFGIVEAITPILGWLIGYIALQYIEKWDHWVVFIIMLFLGINMIYNSLTSLDENDQEEELVSANNKKSFFMLIFTAISTSIDAFAVGVGLAMANVNIYFTASMIGLATCVMVTTGLLLGKKLGCVVGKNAELLGGLVLITIGIITLYQHLTT